MIRRPPRSTLFPTRRSSDLQPLQTAVTGLADIFGAAVGEARAACLAQIAELAGDHVVAAVPLDGARDQLLVAAGADRKSTRLNSSHSQISYAVFCLKKKRSP